MIGKVLSHYEITNQLGEGGMGVVYLAHDTSLDRKVAIKFLPESVRQDETARKRFVREARSAAALDHPYICSIHEVGEAEGKSFIVMEYLEGQTLRDRLAQGTVPLKQAMQWAAEVAEALAEAHEKGIIHRDLKPANIMLLRTGHAKVMDFGLAKQVSVLPESGDQEKTLTAGLTREGTTVGTLPYMSPEQVQGKTVDLRSDLFSFGIVIYEMLTGVNPFKRDSGFDTAGASPAVAPAEAEEFWIDKYEVTNRQFKEFVDAGGYQKREYWKEPFIKDGKQLSWDEAMALFRDPAGRPGPATWEFGTYPEGKEDFPVGGVSWYEAAAYAEYAGKSLPTIYHWCHASGMQIRFGDIVRFSNFSTKGPARVGAYRGLGDFGTYDMAGNLKEWC